jgi:hypothetical protein
MYESISAYAPYASWIGAGLLMSAHLLVSTGMHKNFASKASALGAAISVLAAIGMDVWSVAALNVAWTGISIWGSKIHERTKPSAMFERGLVILAAAAGLLWFAGAQQVAWACSAIYVAGWLGFSLGAITRRGYLLACLVAGFMVVPALIALGAHAFAFNEAFGSVFSAYGALRESRRSKHWT